MAVTFPDKQKWVASLEAAIKSLQRVDATFKRTVSYHQFLSLEVTSIDGFNLEINMFILSWNFLPTRNCKNSVSLSSRETGGWN